jgi:dihydropteroate synthase
MFTMNCRGKLRIVDKPKVMGILNVTPDSFYKGSRVQQQDEALAKASAMIESGADILDIGGQSTRPGSTRIDATTEMQRVIPVIELIKRRFPDAWVSVDTFYSSVAREAVHAGAGMVNDISGGSADSEMLVTVAALQVPYVCMHMKGTPADMQQDPTYADVTLEVIDFFIERIAACRKAGIQDILLDPGFGFGKTAVHNFQLLQRLEEFQLFDLPLVVGLSRKSTIYRTLGCSPEEALNGSTVLHTIALLKGAHILRVHDVKEAVEAVKLVNAYKNAI